MRIVNGMVFCEDGAFHPLEVWTQGDRIAALGPSAGGEGDTLDAAGCYVVPGFVDIHIHGAMGADFSDGDPAGFAAMARFLLSRGVTSFLGTSMALPEARLSAVFSAARAYMEQPGQGGAAMRGIYMEGPFFSPEKRGAQNPDYIVPPDYAMFERLLPASGSKIRVLAVAPELAGGLAFIQRASQRVNVSLGHTCANFATAQAAFAQGANHVTHAFNGMSAFHHRDPGVIGAAIGTGAYVEAICDGVHLHPAVIRALFALFGADRVCLISDAMRACGMPEGQYDLGGQLVTVANGAATIATGSLAGSITPLSDCFRKAVSFGIPLESALQAATINPARSAGLDQAVGSLAVGKRADILLLDRALGLRHTVFGGRLLS